MNGVEAAASLFGPEESASDLFSNLGTGTTSTAPVDNLFLSESTPSSLEGNSDAFYSEQNGTFASDNTTRPDYSNPSMAPQSVDTNRDPYGYSQTTFSEQAYGGESVDTLGSNYLTGASQDMPAPPPTSSYTNSHTPQTYTAPVSNYSTYSPYDPPASASVSYHPPEHTAKATSHQAHSFHSMSSTSVKPPHGGAIFTPPSSLVAGSTVTRPKVSNAYDPPFLPNMPSRRTGRGAAAQQAYNTYQMPPSSATYPPPSEVTPDHFDAYQKSALLYDYSQSSPEVPVGPYDATSPLAQTSPSAAHYGNGFGLNSSNYSLPPSSLASTHSRAEGESYARSVTEDTHAKGLNGANGAHTPQGYHLPQEDKGSSFSRSHPARSASIGSITSMSRETPEHSSVEPGNASPSMVPLPYSPPAPKMELQSSSSGPIINNESAYKTSSQYAAYTPHQPANKDPIQGKDIYDPYAPKVGVNTSNYIPRTSSPLSLYNGRQNEPKKTAISTALNGANILPYNVTIPRTVTSAPPSKPYSTEGISARHSLAPQEIIIKSTPSLYAPSPSLVGANDPLSRTSARAPLVTFGFGGKMITCFHGNPGLNTGFDVALSSRTSSELKLHILCKLLPESALNTPAPSYPGPLVSDPGTPSLSLVRPGASAQTKTKKSSVLAYLSSRVDEIHQGLGYLGPAERQASENKLILVKLLKILVDNDGKLLGTPQAEAAVRSTLVPRLEGSVTLQDGVSLQAAYQTVPLDEMPISVTSLRPSALTKIEEFLLKGDRRQAFQFAMDEKLWAHAMVIASSIDKESWKEVVNDFLRTELGGKDEQALGPPASSAHTPKHSWESLRVAYSLFSGQGVAAVQELSPPNALHRASRSLQPPMVLSSAVMTPRTPNFPLTQHQPSLLPENLTKWAETAAMIISSPLTLEMSGALTALGDQLIANNWVEAAHTCYLLSPQTSLLGGLGTPSARVTLVGSNTSANVLKDTDSLVFSEVLEFALSLVPVVKGQEPFHGLPHLQAYRFVRASLLAEIGEMQLANRYCEAITSSLSQNSPYTTQALSEQLHGLQQRLSGVFHGDKSGSWMGGKLSKPSLDTIGGWLEGRFTKLVTGDSDSTSPTNEQSKASDQPFIGPFAHYSTISSTTPSARTSPQPPSAPFNYPPAPQRTSSAMAISTPYSQVQIERSSSAMGYLHRKPSVATASGINSLPSSQSSPIGYGVNGHSREDLYTPKSHSLPSEDLETPVQGSSWWGSDDNTTSSTQTPTASTFMPVGDQGSSDGFISLMDNETFAFGSQPPSRQASTAPSNDFEEDDDLGLGNSKARQRVESKAQEEADPVKGNTHTPPQAVSSEQPKAATPDANGSGGSWFGKWWKRSDSTAPGPVKASLGEESAFYYDQDLKKWVNKKSAAEEKAKPATLPPPPRAQTASPGMSGSRPPPPSSSTPPPPRASSAIDLTTEPPTKVPMRIRSNLAPPTESAPSTPTGSGLNSSGPPPARPRSQATKRNIRSRYVDVFQEGGAA